MTPLPCSLTHSCALGGQDESGPVESQPEQKAQSAARLKLMNEKAARLEAVVTQADWYDPELNPKIVEFCRYYDFTLLPTRPRTPRHKGKVERGVGYTKSNALRGREFDSLAAENEFLQRWERTIADTRIHGTTKQHVGQLFEKVERAELRPLRGMRILLGLLALSRKYEAGAIDDACDRAWRSRGFRYRIVKHLLERRSATQQTLEFLDAHPLIRPISDYAEFVRHALQQG